MLVEVKELAKLRQS